MLNLLIKDFKLIFGSKQSVSQRIFTLVFSAIFLALFIAIELFLFTSILDNIKNIKDAPITFLTIFMTVATVIMTVTGIFQAKKLFFDGKDVEQLSNKPVSNGEIIFSKMIFLFLFHYATAFLFEYPLLFAYGRLFGKAPYYFFYTLFYPAVTFFFEMGVGLLLVYPVWMFTNFLKKHSIIQLAFALTFIFVLTMVYSYVLEIFINLVADNNMVSLFSGESLAKFSQIRRYIIPVNFLVDIFILNNSLSNLPYVTISAGIFVLGASIAVFAFNYVRNMSVSITTKQKERKYKETSLVKTLIKKEFVLIARNSDYIFSFTGLLVVQPLLIYLVVKAINTVLSTGTIAFYSALVPGLISFIDALIVMLFTVIINQGANGYISAEERTIKNMKTMPVPFGTQLAVKVAIPFALSWVSLFASALVLVLTKTVSLSTGGFTLLITTFLLFIFDIISLLEELNIRHNRQRSTFLSGVFAYLLPIVFVIASIVLSFFKVNLALSYLGGLAAFLIIGVWPVLYCFKNAGRLFLDLEAKN